MADVMFLTPVLPYPTGQGSAMRASIALEVLAEKHRVFVVNTEFWGSLKIFNENWVRKIAAGYTKLPIRPDAGKIRYLTQELFPEAKFEGLYVFRLCMCPTAVQILTMMGPQRMKAVLDLDDNELDSSQQSLALRDEAGDHSTAARVRAELRGLEVFYKMFLPRFDVIFLAAQKDRDLLAAKFPAQDFVYLPNVVRVPAAPERKPAPGRMLFLGSLSYLPNEDGIVYFCEAILPLIRRAARLPFSVRVVGPGAKPRVEALSRIPEVGITGLVPNVGPEYAQASLLIVPLRAGSGTRIKILEAISHRCPVISTTIGAEGLDLVDGEHILIADTPDEFAAACLRLLEDEALRASLAEKAFRWLQATHAMDHARKILGDIYARPSVETQKLMDI